MKKLLALISAVVLASTMLAGCGSSKGSSSETKETTAAETTSAADSSSATGDVDLSKFAGKKVAVVRNLAAGDHTQQFLDGCVSEGTSFGFTVDTYVTDGDDAKTQEVVAQCISKGYDGIILSHGQLSYTYDMLKPARDAGIEVVTFDSMPLKGGDAKGELLTGVTSTAQDDKALAQLSLDSMLSEFQAKGGKLPMKVLKTFMGPGIPPLDRRNEVYTQYEKEGKIKTLEIIAPTDTANARGDMTNKTAAILPKYPEGSVDGIWGCYDELAKGVLQALNDAKRTDIPMYTIDVSNDDINLMRTNNTVWRSTAAVDPKLIGIVDIRLLASKFAGVETPDYYNLAASSIKTDDLNVKSFINPDLCEISEDLVYSEPFIDYNKRNNVFPPNAEFVKTELYEDKALHLEAAKLKFDFMNNAQALIHGDLHTGSIFINKEHTYIFDPEFAFYGPMGYDIGNVIANMFFAWCNADATIEDQSEKADYCGWIIDTIEEIVDKFIEKFKASFKANVTDTMAKTDGFMEWYLGTVLSDTTAVAGLESIRRTVGMANVKDITTIPDEDKRARAEKIVITLAKDYIMNRAGFKSGSDYRKAIEAVIAKY